MSEYVERTIKTFLYGAIAIAMIKLVGVKPEMMALCMACCALAKGGAK